LEKRVFADITKISRQEHPGFSERMLHVMTSVFIKQRQKVTSYIQNAFFLQQGRVSPPWLRTDSLHTGYLGRQVLQAEGDFSLLVNFRETVKTQVLLVLPFLMSLSLINVTLSQYVMCTTFYKASVMLFPKGI
jgi:hypothetical protein